MSAAVVPAKAYWIEIAGQPPALRMAEVWDRMLLELIRELLAEQDRFASHMAAMEMKACYYTSSNLLKNRDPDGKARRRS